MTSHYSFVTVKELKNKWRHVRDGFSRSLNKGKNGDAAASMKKKYTYADSLVFLLNTLEKRTTTGNMEDSDENQDDTSEMEERCVNDNGDGNSANISDNHPSSIIRKANLPNRQKRKRQNSSNLTEFQSQLLKKLHESDTKEEDVDKPFLLSLLGDYKKLSDGEKLDFKFMTLQFFRDIQRQKDLKNHQEKPSTSIPNNFHHSYPGPSMFVQTPRTQSFHNLMPKNYQNTMSPNDSQQSTETSSASSQLTYDFAL